MSTTASIKVKFRPSSINGHEGRIYYQIIKDRKVKQLSTHYHVFTKEWNDVRGALNIVHGTERSSILYSIKERIRWDLECLNRISKKLGEINEDYSGDDVIAEFYDYSQMCSLFNFMESLIARLKSNEKTRTSEAYASALSSFRNFRHGEDIMLSCINMQTMQDYEAYLVGRRVSPNTVSFYMRILRAVYNRAVDDDLIEQKNPFRHVYTGIDKTVKRALLLSALRKIKGIDLSYDSKLDFARDMFLLSFYFRGMSFIDMAFLKKTDLKSGYVTYRRSKTGQQLVIEWTGEMQAILDKYPENKTGYLLPIIKTLGKNERNTYRNIAYKINNNLKKIAEMIHLGIPLTMYVARHSWASVAKAKGIPIGVISEGMGHDSETTTQIYLASLNTSAVDRANSIILKSL